MIQGFEKTLRGALVAALLASTASWASAGTLTILHANDAHSYAAGVSERGAACDDERCFGGYAHLKAALSREKALHRGRRRKPSTSGEGGMRRAEGGIFKI